MSVPVLWGMALVFGGRAGLRRASRRVGETHGRRESCLVRTPVAVVKAGSAAGTVGWRRPGAVVPWAASPGFIGRCAPPRSGMALA